MTAFQQELLNTINDYCNLYHLCEDNCYENVVKQLEGRISSFSWACGATKLVLMFAEKNYVVKIPFFCKYDSEDEKECCAFCEAPMGADWNYCEAEALIYEAAARQGLGICFAKTELLGYANGYPIYIQPRAVILDDMDESDSINNHSQEEIKKVKMQCSDASCYCFNVNWLADCNNYFGERIVNLLLQFINDQGLEDFHNANLGYLDGTPILVDYSDYRE